MKLKIDDKVVKELEDWERKLLESEIPSAKLNEDLEQRALWCWNHKLDVLYECFFKKWHKILLEDPLVTDYPANKESFVNFILSREDYKDRDELDIESNL